MKILDFGLAKRSRRGDGRDATDDHDRRGHTDPGTVMGTVGYMAPEQVRGQAVDARTDLFAFGAVLYEMLTGQRAFQRDTAAETMTAILREDPPELVHCRDRRLPPALDRIVRHCLEKNPARALPDRARRRVRAGGILRHINQWSRQSPPRRRLDARG